MAKKQLAYADIPVAQLGRGATHWYKLRKTGSTDTGYPSPLPPFPLHQSTQLKHSLLNKSEFRAVYL